MQGSDKKAETKKTQAKRRGQMKAVAKMAQGY